MPLSGVLNSLTVKSEAPAGPVVVCCFGASQAAKLNPFTTTMADGSGERQANIWNMGPRVMGQYGDGLYNIEDGQQSFLEICLYSWSFMGVLRAWMHASAF